MRHAFALFVGSLLLAPRPALAEEPAPAASTFVDPKILEAPPGRYPEAMAAAGKEAEVILTLDLDEKGSLTAVAVAKAAGDGFDEAAVEAVKKYRFAPATRDGKPVAARLTYRYQFVLRPAPAAPAPPTSAGPAAPGVPFQGTVREKGTRNPVPLAEVSLDDGTVATIADEVGKFAFAEVPLGKHKVHLRAQGYAPGDTDETFKADKRLDATYYVQAIKRYETVVRGQKLVKQTIEQTLDIEEIKRIPGTQGDPLKAIQTLPGVARAPFGFGNLIVWGSAPGDTRSYVDGVFIPTLYHFGGLRSTVSGELIQTLDFTPGGFGADYGRGLGGVVEIEQRRPKTVGIHGAIDLNVIDGSILLEGALTKKLSFAVAVRRSWIDLFLPLFTSNDFQLSPKYYDYQLALHYQATPRDDLDVFFFGANDRIELLLKNPDPALAAQFANQSYYHRLLGRYVHRFKQGTVLTVTPSIGFDSPVGVSGNFGNIDFHVDAKTVQYNLRTTARVPIARFLRLDAGLDFEGTWNTVDIVGPMLPPGGGMMGGNFGGNTSTNGTIHIVKGAPYAILNFALLDRKLTITPGMRAEVYYFGGFHGTQDSFDHSYFEWEPRLSLRYQFNKYVALKAALGSYHQPPMPGNLLPRFGNPDLRPQSATHYVLGTDIDPTPTLHIELVGFYKELDNLVIASDVRGPVLVNDAQGRVYGGEILVKQTMWKHFFGWISYTLSRAERRDHIGQAWHLFDFDQTHILSLVASYELPRGFQVGLRFRYITGNPSTPVASWYWSANNDLYAPVYGPRNSDRLGAFNQLDVRFDKTWTFRLWKLTIYLDIQNIYNYSNPEAYQFAPRPVDCPKASDCRAPISGLPIIPALGFRGDF